MVAAKTRNTAGSRTKTIRLDKIRLDGDTQTRIELDQDIIKEYATLMESGREFPPIQVVFDGKDYWLWDGFHRRWAAVQAKKKVIKCSVRQGTREDARWLSYGANTEHGLRRTNEDKRKAVAAALQHPKGAKLSDGKIAAHVGVSQQMVSKHREQLAATHKDCESSERTGRDGRTINTANIGRRAEPEDTDSAEPSAPILDTALASARDTSSERAERAPPRQTPPRIALPDDPTDSEVAQVDEWLNAQDERPAIERFRALWKSCDKVQRVVIRAEILDKGEAAA